MADVMAGHQQVMQQFLETQRAVMLGYLGGHAQPLAPLPARPASAMLGHGAGPPGVRPRVALAQATTPSPVPVAGAVPDVEPVVAVDAPPAADVDAPATLSREAIQERLLEMVSERTGYPADMLALEADLEGDLGIDSIKRVEIAGSFTQSLPESARGAIDMEELTASRTLRAVIDTIEASLGAGTANGRAAPASPTAWEVSALLKTGRPSRSASAGSSWQQRALPRSAPPSTLPVEGAVVIIDDGTGVGEGLADVLAGEGHDVLRLPAGEDPPGEQQAGAVAEDLRGRGVKALVHLAALAPEPPRYGGVESLLAFARALGEGLEASAAAGGAVVLAATRLGGGFGIDPPSGGAFEQGALPGFVKSLAQEWPMVRCKAVDLSRQDPRAAVAELRAELTAADGLVEVGYREGSRTTLELRPEPTADGPARELLEEGSVLLVTGGGRGITARVALRLARRYRPTLVLVGRTPVTEEDPETSSAGELAELRTLLIERHRARQRRAAAGADRAGVQADHARARAAREPAKRFARPAPRSSTASATSPTSRPSAP